MRHTLLTTRSHSTAYNELLRLRSAFKTQFKRALEVELFFTDTGIERPEYGIAAYVEPGQEPELEWLVQAVQS